MAGLLNPYLFYIQVGENRSHATVRDDCPGLIVLPSPQALCIIVGDCFDVIAIPLLSCGNIETNPGPDSIVLEQILSELKGTETDITELRQKGDNKKRAVSIILELTKRVTKSEREILGLHQCIVMISDDLENRSWSNNLVTKGIKETENETEEKLREKVLRNVFQSYYKSVTSMQRVHRIKRPSSGRPRPVILHLSNFNEKRVVLRNAKKLKGTDTFIDQEFSSEIRRKQRNLRLSAYDNRKSGQKVALVFDKLKIEGATYRKIP